MFKKMTLTIEIPIDERVEGFIELITGGDDHCGDVLTYGFSGYWAHGVIRAKSSNPRDRAWLIREEEADMISPTAEEELLNSNYSQLLMGTLPKHFDMKIPGYHWFDRSLAIKACKIGCEQFGVDAFLDGDLCDYGDYDTALQKALFGEVVYG